MSKKYEDEQLLHFGRIARPDYCRSAWKWYKWIIIRGNGLCKNGDREIIECTEEWKMINHAPLYWRNHAPCVNAVQICRVYNFKVLFRGFFSVHRTSLTNARWFGAIGNARYKREKNHGPNCLVLPNHELYLADPEILQVKIKDNSKINWQTSITTVRDFLLTFATFLAHLLSHHRLPLKVSRGS
jgi:hypothetical protein